MTRLSEVLRSRPYPGRGCLAARTMDGTLCFVYFLTGRSLGSRSRAIVRLGNGDIAVQDTSPDHIHDPLRHYVAAAQRGTWLVIGNGDQVVPIAESLAAGVDALSAAIYHTYEPDPPIYTSRIWLAFNPAAQPADSLIGYASRSERADHAPNRVVCSLGEIANGTGSLMTTYDSTADQVRLTSAPRDISTTSSSVAGVLDEVWSALDPALRVAALAVNPKNLGDQFLLKH